MACSKDEKSRVLTSPDNSILITPVPGFGGHYSLVVNPTFTGASSGTTHVASVFGRTGAVVAQTGDYDFSQLTGIANIVKTTNSYSNPSWIASLDYSKIVNGPFIPTLVSQLTNDAGYLTSSTAPTNASLLTSGTLPDARLSTNVIVKTNGMQLITISALRAKTTVNAGETYYTTNVGQEGLWKYDSTDTTSADDLATVLVSAGGHRFKRVIEGRTVYPDWWGAPADPTTGANATGPDAGPAFNLMFRWIETTPRGSYEIKFRSNNYFIGTTVVLPYTIQARPNDGYPYVRISGYGVSLRTNLGIPIFYRMPANDADVGTMNGSYKIIIEGLYFIGDRATTVGQTGIVMGCMYGGVIRNCHFVGLYDAIIGNFWTKFTVEDCFFTVMAHRNILLRSLYGLVGTQSIPGSATNDTIIHNCRFFMESGSDSAVRLEATDNTVIDHCIIEGSQPAYGIWSDYMGSTVTNTLIINDMWFEGNSGTTSINFKIAGAGLTRISNVQRTYADKLFDFSGSQAACSFLLDGFTYAGNMHAVPFRADPGNPYMSGQSIRMTNSDPQFHTLLYNPASWTDNAVPYNLTVDHYQGANNGYTLSNGTNIEMRPSAQQSEGSGYFVIRGNVIAKTDNSTDYIGGVPGANFRFKAGYFGDTGVYVDPAGRFRFATATSAGDLSLSRESAGVLAVNDATSGYADIKVKNITISGTITGGLSGYAPLSSPQFTNQIGVGVAASSAARVSLPTGTTAADGILLGDITLFRAGTNSMSTSATSFNLAGGQFRTSGGLANDASVSNAYVNVTANGSVISRNIADGNPALQVIQTHASATGNIVEFRNGSGGQVWVTQAGRMLHATGADEMWYNTSDLVNYERVRNFWSGSTFNIFSEQAGTGVTRGITLGNANGSLQVTGTGATLANRSVSTNLASIFSLQGTFTNSSGFALGQTIMPTVNAAGQYKALLITPFEQSAAGTNYLIDAGTNSAANNSGTHTSKFTVAADGTVTTQNNLYITGFLASTTGSSNGAITLAATGITASRNVADSSAVLQVTQTHASSTGDILQLKNSGGSVVNFAQSGRVNQFSGSDHAYFNTTDLTNYERGRIFWNANIFNIATEQGGTGSIRDIQIVSGNSSLRIGATTNAMKFDRPSTTLGTYFNLTSSGTGLIASTGAQDVLRIDPIVTQTGSASNVMLKISPFYSSTGGGTVLIDAGTAATYQGTHTSKFLVDWAGNTTITGKLTATLTTEQMRLAYDASNYVAFTVASNGAFSITPTGSQTVSLGAALSINGSFNTNATSTNSNLFIPNSASGISQSNAAYLFAGATTVFSRVIERGSVSPTLTANAAYASHIIGTQGYSEFVGASTHALASQLVIKPLVATDDATAVTTNAATVYIEGAMTGVTPALQNDSLWVAAGTTRFGGNVIHSTSTDTHWYNTAFDLTNYERAHVYWNSNVYTIQTENGGTGGARNIRLIGAGTTLNLGVGNGGAGSVFQIDRASTSVQNLANITSTVSGFISSSIIQEGLRIDPTVTQTTSAGTAMLKISPFISSSGSAGNLLIDAGTAASYQGTHTSVFTVNATGAVISTNNTSAAGTASFVLLGAHSQSSGQASSLAIGTQINQSSTGTYKAIWVSPFLNTVGGSVFLMDLGTNSAAGGGGTHTSKFSVDSNGSVSAASTVFVGALSTNGTVANANLNVISSAATNTTTSATLLFAGAGTVSYRISERGSTHTVLTANASYASHVIGTQTTAEFAGASTHALLSQLVIKPLTITDDATATTTDGATVYIEGALTGVTPTGFNDALRVKAGTTRLQGGLALNRTAVADTAYTLLASDHLVAYTSLTATRAVTLPTPASVSGQHFIIKDEAGTAATNNITIVGTVDGAVNPVAVNTAYGVKRIYSNGTAFFSK